MFIIVDKHDAFCFPPMLLKKNKSATLQQKLHSSSLFTEMLKNVKYFFIN